MCMGLMLLRLFSYYPSSNYTAIFRVRKRSRPMAIATAFRDRRGKVFLGRDGSPFLRAILFKRKRNWAASRYTGRWDECILQRIELPVCSSCRWCRPFRIHQALLILSLITLFCLLRLCYIPEQSPLQLPEGSDPADSISKVKGRIF